MMHQFISPLGKNRHIPNDSFGSCVNQVLVCRCCPIMALLTDSICPANSMVEASEPPSAAAPRVAICVSTTSSAFELRGDVTAWGSQSKDISPPMISEMELFGIGLAATGSRMVETAEVTSGPEEGWVEDASTSGKLTTGSDVVVETSTSLWTEGVVVVDTSTSLCTSNSIVSCWRKMNSISIVFLGK